MQGFGADGFAPAFDGFPQFGAGRHPRHLPAFHHGPHILPRAADQQRHFAPRVDGVDGSVGGILIAGNRPHFVRVGNVNKVVRHAGLLGGGGLCRADVHAAVKQPRIGGDDFAADSLGELQRKFGFAHGGGAHQHDEGRFRGGSVSVGHWESGGFPAG